MQRTSAISLPNNSFMLNMGTLAHVCVQYSYYKITHGIIDHLFFAVAGEGIDITMHASTAMIYPPLAKGEMATLDNRLEAAKNAIGKQLQENIDWIKTIRPSQITAERVGHGLLHLLSIESHEWVVGGGLLLLENTPYAGKVVTTLIKPMMSMIPEKLIESVGFKDNFMLHGEHALTSTGKLYNTLATQYEMMHELSHTVDLLAPIATSAMEGEYGPFWQKQLFWVVDTYNDWVEAPYDSLIDEISQSIYKSIVTVEEYLTHPSA